MKVIGFIRCIKYTECFEVGEIYKTDGELVYATFGIGLSLDYSGRGECFNKVVDLHIPILKYPFIYTVLDKLHIKYDKQYKVKEEYKDVGFKGCSNISDMIFNIYNNINLLYKNNLFQVHCCKIKMMIDSIDTYFKMYDNKTLDDKGIQNIYSILCKYNEFLETENNYVRSEKNKNEEKLKNKSSEILDNILDEQNKILDSWIEDLKEFNK